MSEPATPTSGSQSSTSSSPLLAGVERVLIVRLGAMGDVIHALPAAAALRHKRPDLKIGWLIEERWSELLCAREAERLMPTSVWKPLVDDVHIANFSAWRRALFSDETWREGLACVHEVQGMRYQVALDLQGAIRSALAARLSGAPVRIGSSQPREAPARMLYTQAIDPQGTHVVEQALSLMSTLTGEPLQHTDPPFPLDAVQDAWAEEFLATYDGRPVTMLNPGAGWGAKCWPSESFAVVAKALHERGMAVLINHGPREEALVQAVQQASAGTAHLLKCSVGELIAILRRTRLFIGGDTGPMHLAAALHVPVVALFGPTRPERNGPYATNSVVLRSPDSRNNMSHVARPDEGLVSILPEAVIAAAGRLLGAAGV